MGFFKKSGPKVYPKKMIVGLGNPGPQYARTRHNVVFDVIDLLAERHKVKVNVSRKQALIAELELFGVGVALVKPLTFMNLSGRAVKELASSYGIRTVDILVVTDDLDLATGVVRMKPKGSSGGHNGHKSIIASLVLGRFDPDDRALVDRCIERSADGAERWVTDGTERAMNFVNG
jgi:peptidyl-tRNA hydrolase, PTH1 family